MILAEQAGASWGQGLAMAAAIAALGAWWVTWREARRNNRVIIKLLEINSSYVTSIDHAPRNELTIRVENRGMQMQSIAMSLSFRGQGKSGMASVPIPPAGPTEKLSGPFLRGTQAQFTLTDEDLEAAYFLGTLVDFREQEPQLCVYNSGFLARRFRLSSRWDKFKHLWNKFASLFTFTSRIGEGVEGAGVRKTYHPLPLFDVRSMWLEDFLQSIHEGPEGNNASTS